MKRYNYVSTEDDDTSDNSDSEQDQIGDISEMKKLSNDCFTEKGGKRCFSSNVNGKFQQYHSYLNTEEATENMVIYKKVRLNGPKNFNEKRKKCFSKNALMARENRLKKKLYMENLEMTVDKLRCENRKLSSTVHDQTQTIINLKRDINYFKSVLANSSDIGKLLRCVNQNTGMAVTTSVDKGMTLRANNVDSLHPWSETNTGTGSDGELFASDYSFVSNFTWDFDEPAPFEDRLEDILRINECGKINDESIGSNEFVQSEHNYTNESPEAGNFGICLHISNQRVSLEFCPICSEKAATTWEQV